MIIPRILNNRYAKQFGLFTLLTIPIVLGSKSCDNHIINKVKSEIKQKDSIRYSGLNQNSNNVKYWLDELNKVNGSIKMDSVAQKAYFEGAQMVRDSIKNAQNNH